MGIPIIQIRAQLKRMRQQNKKFVLELGDFEPSNIIVNYENLTVMACINSKRVPVANMTVDLGVGCLDQRGSA